MSTTLRTPEVGTAPPVHRHLTTVLWVIVGVLAAALVALGAWVVVDRYTGPEQDATALIDDVAAAMSNGDADALRSLYTSDAVIVDPFTSTGETTAVGLKAITDLVPQAVAEGFALERIAPVTVEGDFATTFLRWSTNSGQGGTVVGVYQLKDGKILREWALQPGLTPPLDNAVTP